ncbi:hypothetical protein EB810_02750 [Altererythrobacter sp. FM1]|uniref:PDZ domain-containing protein n=1 Tax=Tsuneonella flava TaxID=2055955 RepID=UPI000C7FFC0E|nr:PDZ domain-containing protein [Tsuneonella flava]ROT96875.1 hypothetical protein EB810_02750 [Altererythrobacter sp. FM1]
MIVSRITKRAFACFLAIAAPIAGSPAHAAIEEDRQALSELQAGDLRLQTVGWRLAQANAPFCIHAHPAIGLLLQDMANYGDPDAMRAAAGITGDIAVEAVVPGSPAGEAGLAPNDEILSIGTQRMADLSAAPPGDWQRLTGLHDLVDQVLAQDGSVHIEWRRASDGTVHTAQIAGVPVCPSRFELLAKGGTAEADGRRVLIGRKFSGVGYSEPLFAAAVAHELAHNLFAHRAWLGHVGRKQKNIRLTEREADRLMPWLLANAGYDPQSAVDFFKKWGPRNDGWIFRARTHDGWDERAEFVAAELPEIEQLMASEGKADWQTHFKRSVPVGSQ